MKLLAVTLIALVCASGSWAAEEEIQVYLDDHNKPREFGVETHINYVPSGRSTPDYAGEQPPFHVFRFTPELSLGLTDTLEAGMYLLTTTAADSSPNFDGVKLRLKYIPRRPASQTWFWGLNYELGDLSRRVSEQPWTSELKGILGQRRGPWLTAANANIDWDFAGSPTLELDVKLAYTLDQHWSAGVEHYAGIGPLNDLGRLSDQPQQFYPCVDWQNGPSDATFAVGRGLTGASDDWVIRLRIGTTFGGK